MKNAHRFYIDGEWVEPETLSKHDVIDPSTEQWIGTIAIGSAADAEKAIKAARNAFAGFSRTTKDDRLALLKRVLTILKRRKDEIGDMISREMGAPLIMARAEQAGSARPISRRRSAPSRHSTLNTCRAQPESSMNRLGSSQ